MKLENRSKEELELLSFTDLTEMILKETGKPMNTPTIFRTICDALEYSDSEYTDKIGEFYTSLTTDKRFVFLDSAEWDLKDNHSIPVILDEDEDDIEEEELEEENDIEEELDEENLDDIDLDDDLVDDDFEDLDIVDEDMDMEEN